MSYTVNKFDGTFLTTVADGTIDSTTDVRFVGKNYAGYGEIQNENFLHLMENFAGTTPPPKKVVGQLWYDGTGTIKKLKFWDGTTWRNTSGATSATTPPLGLMPGEFWWDSTRSLLNVWNGTEFVTIGPSVDPEYNRLEIETFNEKPPVGGTPIPRTVVAVKNNGSIVAIFSSNDTFELDQPTSEFSHIYKGLTVPGSRNSITNVWQSASYKFAGTATDADALAGLPASKYINSDSPYFENQATFAQGLAVGTLNNRILKIYNDLDNVIVDFERPIALRYGVVDSLTGDRSYSRIIDIDGTGLYPSAANTYDLGSSGKEWNDIYSNTVTANSFYGMFNGDVKNGDLYGDVKLSSPGAVGTIVDSVNNVVGTTPSGQPGQTTFRGKFDGVLTGEFVGDAENAKRLDNMPPSVPSVATTIPARDASGNLYANNFVATGSVNKSDSLLFNGIFVTASSLLPSGAEKRSIVARDSAGDVSARLFNGTATAARYADLAEKYLADKDYEVGTVVAVGGEAEVTAANWGDRAIGVVSENPAFMMNTDLEGGIYIALKGRVPVKVVGAIKKGQRLIASKNGVAVAAVPHANDVFAIALESSDDSGVKLIEAVIL